MENKKTRYKYLTREKISRDRTFIRIERNISQKQNVILIVQITQHYCISILVGLIPTHEHALLYNIYLLNSVL